MRTLPELQGVWVDRIGNNTSQQIIALNVLRSAKLVVYISHIYQYLAPFMMMVQVLLTLCFYARSTKINTSSTGICFSGKVYYCVTLRLGFLKVLAVFEKDFFESVATS